MDFDAVVKLAFAIHENDIRWTKPYCYQPDTLQAFRATRDQARRLVRRLGGDVELFDQAVEYGIVNRDDWEARQSR